MLSLIVQGDPMTYDPYQSPAPAPQLPPWENQNPYSFQAPPPASTNGLAIASLVTSLAGVQLLGVIFGHIALGQIKRTGQPGRGLAVAGLVLGYAVIGLIVVLLAIAIPVFLGQQNSAQDSAARADLANAKIAVIAWSIDNPGVDIPPTAYDGQLEPYGLSLSDSTASMDIGGTVTMGVVITVTSVNGEVFSDVALP